MVTHLLSAHARDVLSTQMHKVAAVMAHRQGLPLTRDEITIKEAAQLVGFQFFKNYLEKRAMFDGILHVMKLRGAQ